MKDEMATWEVMTHGLLAPLNYFRLKMGIGILQWAIMKTLRHLLGVFFSTYLVAYVYTNSWYVVYGCLNPHKTMVVSNTFVHMDRGMHGRWVIFLHYKLNLSLIL